MSVQIYQNSAWKRVADLPGQHSVKVVNLVNYTVLDTDGYDSILVTTGSVDRTITLPTAADNTSRVIKTIKADAGTGKVIVDGEGSETINGTATFVLVSQYNYVELLCTGTEWIVTGEVSPSGQSGVTVKLSANHNLSTSVPTIFQFDTLDQIGDDVLSEWNTSTYRFTAKRNGYYHIGISWFSTNYHGSLASSYTYLYLNGALRISNVRNLGSGIQFSGGFDTRLWLNINDYIEFKALGGGTTPTVDKDKTVAYVYKVS
jgi:hypothetical protein